MGSAFDRIHVVGQQGVVGAYASSDPKAYLTGLCGHCGANQHAVVAFHIPTNATEPRTRWLRCMNCMSGSVYEDGMLYPTTKPLREPSGLPPTDHAIWIEVRACLGVGAYAAAVMLCRKLLFHIAVAHGLPPKNANDRAPGFMEAVKHLESEEVITKKMRPWVDRIKDVGNDVNHELTPITKDLAMDVATFTLQLLVLSYELESLMADPVAAGTPEPEVPEDG